MLTIRRANQRGHANFGWLDTNHTFSFGQYHDPEYMGFRVLRVINEDRVSPGNGFGTHPHKDMEIISYVLSGELEHKDSLGNGSVIKAGEFQIISAGTGITHSEFNPSSEQETHFYQIWIEPEKKGLAPSYEQHSFGSSGKENELLLVASREKSEGSLKINQDVKLYVGSLAGSEARTLPLVSERHGWLQVVKGSLELNGDLLGSSDGASMSDECELRVVAKSDSEYLFFDLP